MILNSPYPESMKRIVALLLIWSMSANILFAVPLRRGTSVIVRLSTSANSNRDTPIRAEVVSDLTIAGEPVITRGTPVILSVNKGKAKGLGKPGYLQIGCISTTAVDGQIISLSGGIEQDGENRQGAAIGLGVGLGLTFLPLGGFFFLCQKGEKVDIPAGTTIFGVTVTDNYDIDIY